MNVSHFQRIAWTLLLATEGISIEQLEDFGISKAKARSWLKSMPDEEQLKRAASKSPKKIKGAKSEAETRENIDSAMVEEPTYTSDAESKADVKSLVTEIEAGETSNSKVLNTSASLPSPKSDESLEQGVPSAADSTCVSVTISITVTSGLREKSKTSQECANDDSTSHEVKC
ncbi:hypothetical protein [Thalassotalea maritima]|uniref:hypothetical protein n=1 Tax=Thalassotalea maritima TaxID=3242416 RepID=UPI00352715AA